jgi:hypothetical protein
MLHVYRQHSSHPAMNMNNIWNPVQFLYRFNNSFAKKIARSSLSGYITLFISKGGFPLEILIIVNKPVFSLVSKPL